MCDSKNRKKHSPSHGLNISYRQVSNYKMHLSRQWNCWSLRCSWSIACWRCSNYIFILDLTPGFNGLGKDDYMTRWESFKFWDLVRLILEILRHTFGDEILQRLGNQAVFLLPRMIPHSIGLSTHPHRPAMFSIVYDSPWESLEPIKENKLFFVSDSS